MNNAPESIYSKLLRAEKDSTRQEIVDNERSKQIRVHLPAKVVAVYGATVDVEIVGEEDTGFGYYSKFPLLLNIPLLYNNYTSSAYIITPVQLGDTGVVEFLDFNAYNFIDNGNQALTGDTYYHSLNNGIFINGFIPNNKLIDIPVNQPIVLGLKNGNYKVYASDIGDYNATSKSSINLTSSTGTTITSPTINLNGDVNVQNGATGTFGSVDGKTISVVDGIIMSIN